MTCEDAEAKLANLTIRAPISGTVLQVTAKKGDRVPDFADALRSGGLVTIARFDQLVIDADVAEKAVGGLASGQMGEATLDAFADQPFAVAIQRIAPEVNSAKGTVSLRLVPKDPPAGIRPGMAARIRIILTKPCPFLPISNKETNCHDWTQQFRPVYRPSQCHQRLPDGQGTSDHL